MTKEKIVVDVDRLREIKTELLKEQEVDEEVRIMVDIQTLTRWENNSREVKKDSFQKVVKMIKKWGQFKPLIVNRGKKWGRKGTVLGGNTRLEVYKLLGINKVWVSWVDPEDEKEAMMISIADNYEAGRYIKDELEEVVENLDFGIDEKEMLGVQLKEDVGLDDLFKDEAEPIELASDPLTDEEIYVTLRLKKSNYKNIVRTLERWRKKYNIDFMKDDGSEL